MAKHFLKASPDTVHWGYFDARIPPVLTIQSGDIVTINTLSGAPDDMPDANCGYTILPEHLEVHENCPHHLGPHFMTGPVAIEGAQAGDVLEVQIIEADVRQDWGWNVIKPLLGTLPEEFPEERLIHIGIDVEAGLCHLPWGKSLALSPFFGVMGVAPPKNYGRISSKEPREHGGNMDNKELVAGTTLYLPIWNEGALFSVGDGHGIQGDGEVCLTALETAMRGTFKLIVRKDISLKVPRAETDETYITMGFDPDLDDAAVAALLEMIDLIEEISELNRSDAYSLCSLAADLRVTQLVDGNKGIHVVLPKSAL